MIWPPQAQDNFQVPECIRCFTTKWEGALWANTTGPYFCGVQSYDLALTFYKSEVASGTIHVKQYLENCDDEGNLVAEYDVAFGGSCIAGDPCSTDDQNPSGLTVNGDPVGCNSLFGAGEAFGALEDADQDETATTRTITGRNTCETGLGTGGAFAQNTSGSATSTLSDPDNETDAILRDNPTEAFFDFVEYGLTNPVYNEWQIPAARFFTYYRAKFRYTRTGMMPSTTYAISVELYRDPTGGFATTPYATLSDSVTTDADGVLIWEAEVPFARGFITAADPATIIVL